MYQPCSETSSILWDREVEHVSSRKYRPQAYPAIAAYYYILSYYILTQLENTNSCYGYRHTRILTVLRINPDPQTYDGKNLKNSNLFLKRFFLKFKPISVRNTTL